MSVNMNVRVARSLWRGGRPTIRHALPGAHRLAARSSVAPSRSNSARAATQVPPGRRRVAFGRERLGIVEPSLGGLVRQVGLPARGATIGRGPAKLPGAGSLAEEQLAAGRHGAGAIQRTLEVGGDLLELLDGVRAVSRSPAARAMSTWAGSSRATSGAIGEDPGPGRRRQRPRDRALGILDLAAGKLQEREAGLAVVPVLVGAIEGLGGGVEIAHPEPDLADRVVRVADARP